MKCFYLLPLLLAFAVTSNAQKQTCITIKGDAHNGKFQQATLSTAIPDQADMTQREIVASAWTCVSQNQDTCNFMALLRFDVSAIPANTVITGARLYLYAKDNNINGYQNHPTYGSDNQAFLQKITAGWRQGALSWNKPPAVTTAAQKILPQSTRPSQNYVVDVTDFVQSWVNNSGSNFGMLLRLQTDKHYNSMIFYSGQAPAPVQPRLEICFDKPVVPPAPVVKKPVTPPAHAVTENKTLVLHGDRTSGKFRQLFLDSNAPYAADTTQPEMGAAAWTCNSAGRPTCNFRSLFRYELSEIPANAKITSARLLLYAKTNNINGNAGNPTFGDNNTVLLQKVTEPWKMIHTGWKNQPAVTTQQQKVLPKTTQPAQNFSINVIDFVQAWVQNPNQNYGLVLRLQTEEYYNSMIFNSGQSPRALQPRLEITYEITK